MFWSILDHPPFFVFVLLPVSIVVLTGKLLLGDWSKLASLMKYNIVAQVVIPTRLNTSRQAGQKTGYFK